MLNRFALYSDLVNLGQIKGRIVVGCQTAVLVSFTFPNGLLNERIFQDYVPVGLVVDRAEHGVLVWLGQI